MPPTGFTIERMAGHARPLCGARTREGRPCRRKVHHVGGTRCASHGGASPNALEGADRRASMVEAAGALLGEDVEPVNDPGATLAAVLGRVRAVEHALWVRVEGAEDRAQIEAYTSIAERLSKLLTHATKLGLMDRALKVEEEKAALFADAVHGILREVFDRLGSGATRTVWAVNPVTGEHEPHELVDAFDVGEVRADAPAIARRHLLDVAQHVK